VGKNAGGYEGRRVRGQEGTRTVEKRESQHMRCYKQKTPEMYICTFYTYRYTQVHKEFYGMSLVDNNTSTRYCEIPGSTCLYNLLGIVLSDFYNLIDFVRVNININMQIANTLRFLYQTFHNTV
jgi:hypothetical protein